MIDEFDLDQDGEISIEVGFFHPPSPDGKLIFPRLRDRNSSPL